MIVFRHCDPSFPFLWEDASQPPARWHGVADGPAQYLSDTPDGAWAEFLRHEEIKDPADLATVRRAIWAVDLPDEPALLPALPEPTLIGGTATYPACQAEARRLRALGAKRIVAPSAALVAGGAAGQRVDGGLRSATPRDGKVLVLFGRRPDLTGWAAAIEARPPDDVLLRVRHFKP
jgi:hypothetical protein